MKRTIVFLKNREDASSYYRIYQYLKSSDCRIVEGTSKRIYRWYYDKNSKFNIIKRIIMAFENLVRMTGYLLLDKLVWHSSKVVINRRLFPRKIPFYGELLLKWYFQGKEVYWDFDDNIIYDGEITKKEKDILSCVSKKIIVTNDFLKNTIDEEYREKVELLPTTDYALQVYDEYTVTEERLNTLKKEVRLIWIGTQNNLKYLETIISQLEFTAKQINSHEKKLKLVIVCNRALEIKTKEFEVENIIWSREQALIELRKAHIGLMPLDDTEYTKGKGGFKAVQYIGMGVPSVVSAVGFNMQVIENNYNGFLCNELSEWSDSIVQISCEEECWKTYSLNARRAWEQSFNAKRQMEYWKAIIE